MLKRITSFIAILSVLLSSAVFPCTTFCLKDKQGSIYFGRNFDFPTGLGAIHINQRNVLKTSFKIKGEKSFEWVSRYGSLTFNQNGREFPYGGINEAGLVIEQLMLDETVYPAIDERIGLEELQWIQYQLDMAATVEDVIESRESIRISINSQAPLHFSIADAEGNFAVIEYLNGKMVYYTGDEAEVHVLANEPYALGLKKEKDNDETQRFVKAANALDEYDGSTDGLEYAFNVLNRVSQGEWTRWTIVYDLKNLMVYYKTGVNKNIRKIALKDFDFTCSSEKLFLGVDESQNSVKDFKKYNYADNYKLIDKVWNQIEFLRVLPLEFKHAWARYPDSVRCADFN